MVLEKKTFHSFSVILLSVAIHKLSDIFDLLLRSLKRKEWHLHCKHWNTAIERKQWVHLLPFKMFLGHSLHERKSFCKDVVSAGSRIPFYRRPLTHLNFPIPGIGIKSRKETCSFKGIYAPIHLRNGITVVYGSYVQTAIVKIKSESAIPLRDKYYWRCPLCFSLFGHTELKKLPDFFYSFNCRNHSPVPFAVALVRDASGGLKLKKRFAADMFSKWICYMLSNLLTVSLNYSFHSANFCLNSTCSVQCVLIFEASSSATANCFSSWLPNTSSCNTVKKCRQHHSISSTLSLEVLFTDPIPFALVASSTSLISVLSWLQMVYLVQSQQRLTLPAPLSCALASRAKILFLFCELSTSWEPIIQRNQIWWLPFKQNTVLGSNPFFISVRIYCRIHFLAHSPLSLNGNGTKWNG